MIERRSHPRVDVAYLVLYIADRYPRPKVGSTIDLSLGGTRIETPYSLMEGERLEISIGIHPQVLRCRGKVVDTTQPDAERGNAGIRLEELSEKEHHRTVGFLAPEELIPSLLLGLGKSRFDDGRFDEALEYLEKVLREYPKSHSAPEAMYLRGVTRYKKTEDAKPLKEAYEQLKDKYPSSEWTKRAYPYRLL